MTGQIFTVMIADFAMFGVSLLAKPLGLFTSAVSHVHNVSGLANKQTRVRKVSVDIDRLDFVLFLHKSQSLLNSLSS